MLRDPDRPMLNLAIGEQYPPGSTYKLVTGSGALQDRQDLRDDADPDRAVHPDRPLEVLGLEQGGLRLGQHPRRLRPLERHVLLPTLRHARHRPARVLGAPVRLRGQDRHRPARRGGRDRPDERVEAARAEPDLLHRRALPGRHRPGLRRGHAAPAPQRVRGARERRDALSPAARAAHRSTRTARRSSEVKPEVIRKLDIDRSVLRTMRVASPPCRDGPPHVQPRGPADRRGRQVGHGRVRHP